MNLHEEIKNVIPGGIDGNAKVFPGEMPIISKAKGAYMYDTFGYEYIDYVSGYGPLLFGHSHPGFLNHLNEYMQQGILYGFPHKLMYDVGKKITEIIPCAEMIRFTNTGTEATLNALRLAKGITQREKIVKFYGGYHGTHDFVLIGTKKQASDVDFPFVSADSAGITKGVQKDTYTLQFNDSEGFRRFMKENGEDIAAVIVEPVLGSFGLIADNSFMKTLREETERFESLLIFDEIITGFRLGLGGAQEYYGIIPDITTLGKVLGGGIPIGAFVGRKVFMERIIPQKGHEINSKEPVYHSGTFNSNPLSLAAAKWVLTKLIDDPNIMTTLNSKSDQLRRGFEKVMKSHGIKGITTGMHSIFQWYFGLETEPKTINDITNANFSLLKDFHREMVKSGVLFIGTPRGYVSSMHTDEDIKRTINYADLALAKLL